jgi:hypothetical protein
MPNELHLALQRHYAGEDGALEALIGGFRVDALRDGVAYEIQTRNFRALREKLAALTSHAPVVLVYPLAQTRFLVRLDPQSGAEVSSRRSPKHGRLADVGWEIVYLAEALRDRRLSLEVLLTVERELRRDDGQGSWRRGGVSIVGRELVAIVETHRFDKPKDFARLLPAGLPRPFTVADLAARGGLSGKLAGRLAYGLRGLGVLEVVGKKGNAYLYRRVGRKRHTPPPTLAS